MPTPRVLPSFDTLECVEARTDGENLAAAVRHPESAADRAVTQSGQRMAVNLIEAAMNRAVQSPMTTVQQAQTQAANDRLTWQHEQDAALKRRLAQLENAQTAPTPSPPVMASSRPVNLSSLADTQSVQAQPIARPASTTRRPIALWLAAPASILGAVGLSWIMLGADNSSAPANESKADLTAPVALAPPMPVAAPSPDPLLQVRDVIEQWRQAWMARDASAYLGLYSPDFVPPHGQSHDQWLAARRQALARPAAIEVRIASLRLQSLDKDRVKAEFAQDYHAGAYREVGHAKTLILTRSDKGWLITRELSHVPAKPQTSQPANKKKATKSKG